MMAAESVQAAWGLRELLQDFAPVPAEKDVPVYGLSADSRRIRPGDLFLACAGRRHHGLAYLNDVVRAGAVAVVWEPVPGAPELAGIAAAAPVPALPVADLGIKTGMLASRFFEYPSRDLLTVGVAGTDGKTSCSHFIAQVLGNQACPCGLLGTLGYGVFGRLEPGIHTTPDAVTLQSHLAEFRNQGLKNVVMEVSSHALEQGRVNGVEFDIALFTNLGRDHLDFHGSMEAYGRAKRRLFEQSGLDVAVLNTDDPFSREIVTALPGHIEVIAYGLGNVPEWIEHRADLNWVTGHGLQVHADGIRMDVETSWGSGRLQSGLLGDFNARNLLGTLGVALAGGVPLSAALPSLARIQSVPGRMECFRGEAGQPLVVADYAHTPQALEHALRALRPICSGSLWCVFGAGGQRDTGKRPLMGAVAERYADQVILTDDNPRGEDPQAIITGILTGVVKPDVVWVEHNRAVAIRRAIESAAGSDVVLIAGKGHETYQEIGDRRFPFDDRRQIIAILGRDRS